MTDITLMDGGMGQELVHRAGDNPTPLWSTQVMVDHPGLVAAVHAESHETYGMVIKRSQTPQTQLTKARELEPSTSEHQNFSLEKRELIQAG